MTSVDDVAQWWGTSVSRMEPGLIELRGHPIQELIGSASLPAVIWLLIRGSRPAPGEAALLEAALVASVDHGPQAPSIAAARMAVTCGVGLNTAIATGAGMLGDVHGGAGEQAVRLFGEIREAERAGQDLAAATGRVLAAWRARSR
ncbi:MAG: citrate/2-methylcitrate synthase, partial [Trebonia sp.]